MTLITFTDGMYNQALNDIQDKVLYMHGWTKLPTSGLAVPAQNAGERLSCESWQETFPAI